MMKSSNFPMGYETVVGERGVSLSGGQRQRISIARAILRNPEIVILDDALSAVDAKTEAAILQAFKQKRDGKTNIITAHRLSAIQHASLILVLDEGRLVEKGTHQRIDGTRRLVPGNVSSPTARRTGRARGDG